MAQCSIPIDLITLITTIFTSQCIPDAKTYLPENYAPLLRDNAEFDFIIVGGGSAGCVLANRLSENPNWRILLLEAGTYPSKLSEIPYLFPAMYLTDETWKYKNAYSSSSCLGYNGNRCISAYAKMLGGTSNLDFMTHLPGTENDYDNWSNLGNPGWEWKNVSGYYEKSKEFLSPTKVESQTYFTPIREAYQELGYPYNVENTYNQLLEVPLNVKDGQRLSVAKAYLSPVQNRNNLFVALNAQVTKLKISQDAVTGVEVQLNLRQIDLKIKKEVIVSCGAANSAKLLMLSGIGPKEVLQNSSIQQIKELPVGRNLQDHCGTMGVLMRVDDSPDFRETGFGSKADIEQFFTNFTGPLASSNMNLYPYFTTKNESVPNFYILFVSLAKGDPLTALLLSVLQFNPVSTKSIVEYNLKNHLIFAVITLVDPASRGSVKLQPENPKQDPIIDNNYLGNVEDVNEFLKAIDSFKNVLKTKALSDVNASLVDFDIPNCQNEKFDSQLYWICNLRNFGTSLYFPGGTCKMGPSTDPSAVVSSTLNVHGVKNVRVVDASVMPKVTRLSSNIPEVIIAEKASDLIKNSY